ncbi:MAG TPA: Crp/Fnr family transcriptional regulator [Chromatiales bacterium]|nr:Crp/Fnr family transcriptional regulator [Chromatiales bacterium]HIP53757.1 Crp/Fnr family transcriptional regulator [Chromatiales bacterium]
MASTRPDPSAEPAGLSDTVQQLFAVYPELADADQPEWLDILEQARLVEFPAHSTLMTAGAPCDAFLLMLEGNLRLYQIADDGREVTLYRTNPGHICLLSLNSLIHDKPFRANAVTETDIRALMLSAEQFHRAMQASEQFRNLVLSNLMNTVCAMVDTFYDTAFQTLDMRLACLLGRLFERAGSNTLHITHQDLAQDLGTSREVVSRLLKRLEHNHCIRLSRGRIELGENRSLPGPTP